MEAAGAALPAALHTRVQQEGSPSRSLRVQNEPPPGGVPPDLPAGTDELQEPVKKLLYDFLLYDLWLLTWTRVQYLVHLFVPIRNDTSNTSILLSSPDTVLLAFIQRWSRFPESGAAGPSQPLVLSLLKGPL